MASQPRYAANRTGRLFQSTHSFVVRLIGLVELLRGFSYGWPGRVPEFRTAAISLLLLTAGVCKCLYAEERSRSTACRHALNEIFTDFLISDNARSVRRRAILLPPDQRFEALAEWVLPNSDHPRFRLAGEFTTTHPPPMFGDDDPHDVVPYSRDVAEAGCRIETGGNIVSPSFALIDVAQQLGRLQELRRRIDIAPVIDDENKRAKCALLVLLDLAVANGRIDDAVLDAFLRLATQNKNRVFLRKWPETLVLSRGLGHELAPQLNADLIQTGLQRNLSAQNSYSEAWGSHTAALVGLSKHLSSAPGETVGQLTSFDLKNWIPVSYADFRTRGMGRPRAYWHHNDGRVDNLAGHDQDFLFYRIPLRGDYEIECDVTSIPLRDSHLMVAGTVVAPGPNSTSFGIGNFRSVTSDGRINPPLARAADWIHYRAVVRSGKVTTYFNGRRIHKQTLATDHSPWLAIRSPWRHQGAVRNLRISGSPVVPKEIRLAETTELSGWVPYFAESVATPDADWHHQFYQQGNGITGRRKAAYAGSGMQSLLRHHRPMTEDGTIEYEFFWQPGVTETHPAFGRLAFLLDPAGIRLHWITDGKYDQTGLSPTNVFDESDARHQLHKLPLKTHDWNRLQLTLRGNVLDLLLNDQLVYQRELESTNLRTFGLFHYADQTDSRVRNIVWRGDWPRKLPPVQEQELAGNTADFGDDRLPELACAVEYDFMQIGLPEDHFLLRNEKRGKSVWPKRDGIHVAVSDNDPDLPSRVIITPRIDIQGDFDITATFEELDSGSGNSTLSLVAVLDSSAKHGCKMIRARHKDGHQTIIGQVVSTESNGRKRRSTQATCEAISGRLRLARRGDQVHTLFAEGDSPVFRLVSSESATTDDVAARGLQLITEVTGGRASVVWKDIRARADRIMYFPTEEVARRRGLFVLTLPNENGSRNDSTPQVRTLAMIPNGYGHQGSPNWSYDGKAVAYDLRKNPADYRSTEMMIVNTEGEPRPQFAAIGLMPSLSPDRKQMVFNAFGAGVTMANSDGTNPKVLDARGWGTQWAPDGRHIAWLRGNNFIVMGLDDRQQREILLPAQTAKISRLFWHFTWSWDSTKLAFKANNDKGEPIAAIADVNSTEGFRIIHTGPIQEKVAWHPDGRSVAFIARKTPNEPKQIYVLDTTRDDPPKLLVGQPATWDIIGFDWAPDGKRLVLCAEPPVTGVEWRQPEDRKK